MMLRNYVAEYFLEKDYNCAESLFLAANDYYKLGMTAEDSKLISAFGAGMGCERTCGALAGAMAIFGKMKVEGRAHVTSGYRELCAELTHAFEEKLGSTECSELKPRYRREDVRCLQTVELAADVLEEFVRKL